MSAFFVLTLLPLLVLLVACLAASTAAEDSILGWLLPSSRGLSLLGNSLLLAGTVSVMAAVFGTGLALWIGGEGRWQTIIGSVYLIPLLIPAHIHAQAWMAVAGRRQLLDQALSLVLGSERPMLSAYGFWPAAVVLTLATFPIVVLLVRAGLEAIDPELLEAGALSGPPWPVTQGIVSPLVAPSIVAGAGLVFVLTLVEYGVPSLLQHNTYVMEVYASFSQDNDPMGGLATSLALLMPAAAALVISQWPLRNSPLRGRPGFRVRLSTRTWPPSFQGLLLASVGLWTLAAAVPFFVLLVRGGTPTALVAAAASARREMAATLLVAVTSGAVATVVALPVSLALVRLTSARGLGWLLCALPLAVPAPVMGIALVHLWNQAWLDWSYNTRLMLVITHVARFLPFAVFAASSRVRHLDPLLVEAASLHDVGWWRRLLWVHVPLTAPAMVMSWLVVFVFSLGELGASLLVAPPGEATLSMRIYNLLHYGATETVSSLSLVVLALAIGASLGVLALHRQTGERAA